MTAFTTITVTVNGRRMTEAVATGERLLDSLRRWGYTEAKEGCGSGECGACSVLVDDAPICACLTFSVQVDGRRITTAAGIATEMPRLIDALVEHTAVQCGFCTPGIVVSAGGLLRAHPHPTHEQILERLEGNLCRCTGYHRIVQAIEAVGSSDHGVRRP
jgi:aerobic-type carbon monoxide dehydrogenase small subunit (CoxS/CutS family)